MDIEDGKKYNAYAWALLAIVLAVGLLGRYQIQEWVYSTLWITEIITFILLALYIYDSDAWTAFGAFFACTIWLANQLLTWYGFGNMYLVQGFSIIYALTALGNIALLVYVLRNHKRSTAGQHLPVIDALGPKTSGQIAFALMCVFSIWKLYEAARQFGTTTPTFYSAGSWAIGILLMSIGSAFFTRSDAVAENDKKYLTYLIYIGLLISAYASFAYGLALSLTGL